MPGQLPVNGILQPGAISKPAVDRALISALQLLTPQYYKRFTEIYGSEKFMMWLATFGGMETVKNRNFFWFQNRGKLMIAVTNKTAVTAPAAGATVTVTIIAGDHYDSGTLSPLRVGETVRIASSNIEGKILSVDTTTPSAHSCTIRPLQSTQAFASAGSNDLVANEILIFGGDTEAGEASDSIQPLIDLDEKLENTVTEIRESWAANDLAEMTEIFYDSGVSGRGPNGVQQAGDSYFTYKGLVRANKRFLNNIEAKLMRGDIQNNTGLTNSVGTVGFINQVIDRGQTVTYTPGSLDLAKIHDITRVMDVQGAAKEYLWLMDVNQRQDFSDSLFSQFPAGAWVWGQNERSEEAALVYGVQSVKMDDYLLKVKKNKEFNTEVTTGKSPLVDYFRNFGILIPQGEVADSRDSTKLYKNIQVMMMDPPKGGTIGNGIRVWQHGGGSRNPTDGKMVDKVEMITYRGVRVVAANQYVIVEAA